MPRTCTASRHEKELREMVAARWTKRSIASALGVHPDTITNSVKKLGIVHGNNRWTLRKFKSHPVVATLREERMARALSVDEFAKRVGYHRSIVGQWERGARRMSLQAVTDFAQALGFEVTLRKIGG